MLLLIWLNIWMASFTAGALCWFIFHFVSTRTARSVSANLLSNQLMSGLYCCVGFLCPRCRKLLLLNLSWFLSVLFSSLWRPILTSCPALWPINSFPHYLAVVYELGGSTVHPIIQVINLLSVTGLGICPQETLLVTNGQLSFLLLLTALWTPQSNEFFTQAVVHVSSPFLTHSIRRILRQAVEGHAAVQVNNIHSTPFIHRARHLTTEGGQTGQAQSPHGTSMLAVLSHLPVLHVLEYGFQEDVVHNLPGDWG